MWVGEHHTGAYENIPAPDIFIAKASALTSRIALGTGTINLPYHDPFMVAERLAFLDHLTHGRLIYGFGGGGLVSDKLFFQVRSTRRRRACARRSTSSSCCSRPPTTSTSTGSSGSSTTSASRCGRTRSTRSSRSPGMSGTHNFELCGERGYAALSIYFTPVQIEDNPGMPDLIAQGNAIDEGGGGRRARSGARHGNDWRICREVYVSDSKNAAMDEIRETLKQSYDYLFKIGLAPLMKRDASMPDAEVTFDWMVENMPVDHRLARGRDRARCASSTRRSAASGRCCSTRASG